MVRISEHISLLPYNTFGIDVQCKYFTEVNNPEDLRELLGNNIFKSHERLILGGGSNVLFTKNFDGIVVKNSLKGIEIVKEIGNDVHVKAMAGEVWHEFVMWCIDHGLCGLENLSLIPGCVGASPMQNIGAYGVEIKDVFHELEACDLNTGEKRTFSKEECKFGYRESVFKHEYKNRYIITSVTFRLQRNATVNVSYGAISSELQNAGVSDPGIRDVSQAVIRIRQSKLPDPKVCGNAGSFFKNPEISAEKHEQLRRDFPQLVSYPLENGRFKLAAGWLIEQCGLKGYQHKGAAVHDKQALVLVNKEQTKGSEVFELSELVMQKVNDKFGVQLEREVNIL